MMKGFSHYAKTAQFNAATNTPPVMTVDKTRVLDPELWEQVVSCMIDCGSRILDALRERDHERCSHIHRQLGP